RQPTGGRLRSPGEARPADNLNCRLPVTLLVETGVDQEVISLQHSKEDHSATCQIRILFNSPSESDGPRADPPRDAPAGISESAAHLLTRFSASGWFPAMFFAASITVLLQFRRADSVGISAALRGLDSLQVLVPMVSLLIVTVVITRAFSFEA